VSHRRRTILVWVLIVLGALIALVGSLTVWVKRQALDTNAWTDASAQLIQDNDIRQALSVYIVDQLYQNVDVAAALQERLPKNVQGLAAPLAGALRSPAERAVDEFLQRPRVEKLWVEANRVAQERLVAILEGQPRANVSTAGGDVTLDLRSFVIDIAQQFGLSGNRLEAKLPPDTGQVVVLRSDQLKAAQDVVKAIKALSWLLIFVTFLLWALAVWLARGWRREALRAVAVSLVIVGLLLLVARQLAGNYIVDALTKTESARPAANSVWLIGTSLITDLGWAFIFYGVVTLLGVWLVGSTGLAGRAREHIAPVLRDRPVLGWAVVAAIFLLLVWWAPTPAFGSFLGVLILGVLAAVGFEVLRRAIAAETAA
jgi:NADH:ubiquinone oxidoreductase subunit 6 (subunit J)